MKIKRVVVAVILLTVLAAGTVTPKPARADTTEAFIIAGVVLAGYVAVVFLATAWVYRNDSPTQPFGPGPIVPPKSDEPAHRVHAAAGCAQTSPNLTLLCW